MSSSSALSATRWSARRSLSSVTPWLVAASATGAACGDWTLMPAICICICSWYRRICSCICCCIMIMCCICACCICGAIRPITPPKAGIGIAPGEPIIAPMGEPIIAPMGEPPAGIRSPLTETPLLVRLGSVPAAKTAASDSLRLADAVSLVDPRRSPSLEPTARPPAGSHVSHLRPSTRE